MPGGARANRGVFEFLWMAVCAEQAFRRDDARALRYYRNPEARGIRTLGTRGRIFISYRRDDAPGDATNLYKGLVGRFGKANVFMDVDKLLAGQRFDRELDKALAQCNVLIAVIGPRWMELLSQRARGGERDFVHDEIAAALKRNIVVIPVLIGREERMPSLPPKNDLPEDIRELVLYHKHSIAHERSDRDIADLITAITFVLRGERRAMPWRAIAISGAIGSTLIAVLIGYRMEMIPWIGPNAVQPRSVSDAATVAAQLDSDANRAAKVADEVAKKKVLDEDANRRAAEAARRQADADTAKKKADAEAAKKKAEEEAGRKAAEDARRQADADAAKKKAEEEATKGKAAADCDRLAASPLDATRQSGVTGVNLADIDTGPASIACNAAMLDYPAVARFAYQVGRVADAKKDYTRAIALYGVAAEMGHVAAMTALGLLYSGGRGVQPDLAEARKWLGKAAALGDAPAISGLGSLAGAAQNYAEARKWYEKAAALGNAEAMNNLGELYDDPSFFDRLFGNRRAKYRLDYNEAGKWYMKAVALGDATAMFNLGKLYEQGHGVAKDAKQARQWYQKAANAGNGAAQERLKNSR